MAEVENVELIHFAPFQRRLLWAERSVAAVAAIQHKSTVARKSDVGKVCEAPSIGDSSHGCNRSQHRSAPSLANEGITRKQGARSIEDGNEAQ